MVRRDTVGVAALVGERDDQCRLGDAPPRARGGRDAELAAFEQFVIEAHGAHHAQAVLGTRRRHESRVRGRQQQAQPGACGRLAEAPVECGAALVVHLVGTARGESDRERHIGERRVGDRGVARRERLWAGRPGAQALAVECRGGGGRLDLWAFVVRNLPCGYLGSGQRHQVSAQTGCLNGQFGTYTRSISSRAPLNSSRTP